MRPAWRASGRGRSRGDGVGQGQQAFGFARVQVLDQRAVDHRHPLARGLGRAPGVEPLARAGEFRIGRGEGGVGGGDLPGVDQRLAVEALVASLASRGGQAGVVIQVQVHAVQHGQAMGARGQHRQ